MFQIFMTFMNLLLCFKNQLHVTIVGLLASNLYMVALLDGLLVKITMPYIDENPEVHVILYPLPFCQKFSFWNNLKEYIFMSKVSWI